ncbi:MAG: CZB domain-containing protein [Sulfuricurvum sp.]
MNKEETLLQLQNAKKAHLTWVNRARSLIEGLPIEKEQVPVYNTDCQFGQWFYGEGQRLNRMPSMDCLKEIETLHTELHEVYMKIFRIYFSDEDRSFLSKLFGTRKKVSQLHQEIAKDYYDKLRTISEKLINAIERLERRLVALNEQSFA